MSKHPDRVRGAVGFSDRFDFLHRYVAAVRVQMRVDQAGHHRSPADVEYPRIRGRDRLCGDVLNQSVADAQLHALRAIGIRAVEDAGVLEQQRRHRRSVLAGTGGLLQEFTLKNSL
jgi:hypothetical protein